MACPPPPLPAQVAVGPDRFLLTPRVGLQSVEEVEERPFDIESQFSALSPRRVRDALLKVPWASWGLPMSSVALPVAASQKVLARSGGQTGGMSGSRPPNNHSSTPYPARPRSTTASTPDRPQIHPKFVPDRPRSDAWSESRVAAGFGDTGCDGPLGCSVPTAIGDPVGRVGCSGPMGGDDPMGCSISLCCSGGLAAQTGGRQMNMWTQQGYAAPDAKTGRAVALAFVKVLCSTIWLALARFSVESTLGPVRPDETAESDGCCVLAARPPVHLPECRV